MKKKRLVLVAIAFLFLAYVVYYEYSGHETQCPYRIECLIDDNGVCRVTQWAPYCVGLGDPINGPATCVCLSVLGPDCRCVDNVCSPDCEQIWRQEYNANCCWPDLVLAN